MFSRKFHRIKTLVLTLVIALQVLLSEGCGTDINRDLLKPCGGGVGFIEQLPGNDNPLTPQDIGEFEENDKVSVCGFVDETGSGLANFGAFYSLVIAASVPAGTILEGTLEWGTASSFVLDVWVYVLPGLPIPLPLNPDDYLEKTDTTFRLEVQPEEELVINVKGISGDPGAYTVRLALVPSE